jgi:hypothetical protein
MTSTYGNVQVITKPIPESNNLSIRVYEAGKDVTQYFDGILGKCTRKGIIINRGRFNYRDVKNALLKVGFMPVA